MSAAPTFLDVFRFESHYAIVSTICSLLQIGDIVALTRTCKALSKLYQCLLPSQWNVDRYLGRFISNPQHFRSLMGRHGALVSGPLAMRFFERALWKGSDNLAIFVQEGRSAEAFCAYLTRVEGYDLAQSSYRSRSNSSSTEVIKIHTYGRPDDAISTQNTLIPFTVDVFYTKGTPLHVVLAGQPLGVAVNFFSSSKAYSLYPSLTFLQPGGSLLQMPAQLLDPLTIPRSGELQWAVGGTDWSSFPGLTSRRVGDRFTWTIKFDMSGVRRPKKADPALEYPTCGVDIYVDAALSTSTYRVHAPISRLKLVHTWDGQARIAGPVFPNTHR